MLAAATSSTAPWAVAVIVLATLLVGVLFYNGLRVPAPKGPGLGVYTALLSAAGSAGVCGGGLFAVFATLHLL